MATWLLAMFVRGLVVCAVGCIAVAAMRGRPAAHRALIWTVTLGALGALPWVGAVAPTVEMPVLPAAAAPEVTAHPGSPLTAPVTREPARRPAQEQRVSDPDQPAARQAAPESAPPARVADVKSSEPAPAGERRESKQAAAPDALAEPPRQPKGATGEPSVELLQTGKPAASTASATWDLPLARILVFAVAGAWILGVVALLFRVARGWLAAYRLQVTSCEASASVVEELRDLARRTGAVEPTLRISSEASLPMAVHLGEPTILVPVDFASWPAERRQAVLLHELAHLQRYDTWVQLAARIVVAVHWPNPLAWFALRRLWIERERACDDHVLRSGLLPSRYATHLLELARLPRTPVPAAAASFLRRRQLPDRLRAVLDPELVRESPTRRTLVFVTALALVALLPIAAGQPVAAALPEALPAISEMGPATPEPEAEPTPATGVAPAQQQPSPTIDELVKMRIHGVSPEFVQAMSAHADDLDVATLVQLRIHGVSPDYVDEMYDALGETLTLDQLVQGRIHGVSPDFARAAAAQFGREVAFKDLVQMRIHGASGDYVRDMQRLFSHETLEVRDVVQMRIHGASTDFVETMQGLLPDETLDVSDVVQMRIHGVSAGMIRDLQDRGIDDLTVEELVKMRIHGIDRILRRRDGGAR